MENKKGFTLLELLIVIAILAILAAAVLVVINPAEILKKSRDTRRVNDLDSLRSALAMYITDVSSPDLDGAGNCSNTEWISTTDAAASCRSNPAPATCNKSEGTAVDGSGWIPVNLSSISTGSPIASLPLDPTNDDTYFYSYRCDGTNTTFELNANLESTYYTTTISAETKDGGNDTDLYEVGTDPGLDLISP